MTKTEEVVKTEEVKSKKNKKNKIETKEEPIETKEEPNETKEEPIEKPKKIKKNKVLLELITWKSNTYFLNPITNEIFDVIDDKPSNHIGNLINSKVKLYK